VSAAKVLAGAWTACLTPFRADGSIDDELFIGHCRAMVAENCGVSLFGTTGEGTAISPEERMASLDRVIAAGIAPDRIIPGIGFCDTATSARVIGHAVRARTAAVLVLPPFYMKGVSDEGLFRHFADIIEKVGSRELKLLVYNFPALTSLTLAPDLVRRLADAYPGTVIGIKDSSAEWSLSSRYLELLPDLSVFLGDERSLLANLRHGGAGTISGMANVIGGTLAELCATFQRQDADAIQARIAEAVSVVLDQPFIPLTKAMVAARSGEKGWLRVRPPLEALDLAAGVTAARRLAELGLLRQAA
jgi:4-hydroxy-tetrahydrodipicolinate synthase